MRGQIQDFNFRELHHEYILLINPDPSMLLVASKDFSHEPGDNALLVYGYIDAQAGISFELLCMAKYVDGFPIVLRAGCENTSVKYRYDSITGELMNLEFVECFLDYYKKVKMIENGYRCNNVAEEFRKIRGVDKFRHPQFPDDLLVFFIKGELQREQIWVRISGMKDGNLAGILLNEPYQNFGVHEGQVVGITHVNGEDAIIPIAVLEQEDDDIW